MESSPSQDMLRMLHISTKNEINAREYERIWLQRQVESIEIAELLLARERLPVTESAETVAPPLQQKPQQEPQSPIHAPSNHQRAAAPSLASHAQDSEYSGVALL